MSEKNGNNEFIDLLRSQGYRVTQRKLGGGFVNDVRLITAQKDDQVFEYVQKTYGSENDMKDMLRGYDAISSVVKTPSIVFQSERQVVYDLVHGKSIVDMIKDKDPKASEAVRLLAKELEKLHQSESAPPRYKRGDSPDEKKMLRHVARCLENDQITRDQAHQLVREIREYIPKNKSIIHGDAHLGNFLYSNGEVVFIDPDNTKISDYNADIGKVVHAIHELADHGNITQREASALSELFLLEYEGEDEHAVNLYRTRTPLIQLKNRARDTSRKAIRRSLESRIASIVIFLSLVVASLMTTQLSPTGNVVRTEAGASSVIMGLLLVLVVALISYHVFRKEKK